MPPRKGSRHEAPRSDSKVPALWAWLKRRKRPWTIDEAAEGSGMSRNRCRMTVLALHKGGYVIQEEASRSLGYRNGFTPPTWRLAPSAEAIDTAPILVKRDGGFGIRFPEDG